MFFIVEAGFHINMKRSLAWLRKEDCDNIKMPSTRRKMNIIIGIISPYDMVNTKVKTPRVIGPSKIRKTTSGESAVVGKGKGGTVTGHYFNFVAMTLDVIDEHEMFKGHYLVIVNTPINKHETIMKYIESCGYGCIYFLPCSLGLNPIEQFWSVCKKERLLKEETLTSKIRIACNYILVRGFVWILQVFCRNVY